MQVWRSCSSLEVLCYILKVAEFLTKERDCLAIEIVVAGWKLYSIQNVSATVGRFYLLGECTFLPHWVTVLQKLSTFSLLTRTSFAVETWTNYWQWNQILFSIACEPLVNIMLAVTLWGTTEQFLTAFLVHLLTLLSVLQNSETERRPTTTTSEVFFRRISSWL